MTLQKLANTFARKNGYNRATEIEISDKAKNLELGKCVSYGYRKNTTGEYVPNSYRANFGWKNTYYQPAIVTVIVPATIAAELEQ